MGVATPREKQLLEIIERQAAQLKKCDEIISRLEAENALLRQRVDLLVRKVFGPSSEKLDPSQLEMFLQGGENSLEKTLASSALEEAESVLPSASPRTPNRRTVARRPARGGAGDRPRGGQGRAGPMALHRFGSQRATRL